MIVNRRPMKSARSPAMMAPKKVLLFVSMGNLHQWLFDIPSGQDRSDQRLLPRRDNEDLLAVFRNQRVQVAETGIFELGVFGASVLIDEVVHVKDTTHPTGIISEEDTTERCESNDEVGPKGDGSLNAVYISRAGDGDDSTSWHDCGCCDSRLIEGGVRRQMRLFVLEEESRAVLKGGEAGMSARHDQRRVSQAFNIGSQAAEILQHGARVAFGIVTLHASV
jgi:hypothetical protein